MKKFFFQKLVINQSINNQKNSNHFSYQLQFDEDNSEQEHYHPEGTTTTEDQHPEQHADPATSSSTISTVTTSSATTNTFSQSPLSPNNTQPPVLSSESPYSTNLNVNNFDNNFVTTSTIQSPIDSEQSFSTIPAFSSNNNNNNNYNTATNTLLPTSIGDTVDPSSSSYSPSVITSTHLSTTSTTTVTTTASSIDTATVTSIDNTGFVQVVHQYIFTFIIILLFYL